MENDVLKRAVDTWGVEAQTDMVIEEALELCLALHRRKRGRGTIDDVIDEVADLQIMLKQIEIIIGSDRVRKRREFKLNRLSEKLKKRL